MKIVFSEGRRRYFIMVYSDTNYTKIALKSKYLYAL